MSKLTLSIDESVISAAKRYARSRGIPVSRLVETYLGLLSRPPHDATDTPALRSIRGMLRKAEPKQYKRYLARKYR